MSEAQWLDQMEALFTSWCEEPHDSTPIDVADTSGRIVLETCSGGQTLLFASEGRGYRAIGSGEHFAMVASSIELDDDMRIDQPASAGAWRGIWPQESREEGEAAQAAANAGDPSVTWQVDADGGTARYFTGEDVALRFISERLEWEEFRLVGGSSTFGGGSAVSEPIFVRCEPYDGVSMELGGGFSECPPPDDGVFDSVVVIRLERLVSSDRRGIWIVTRADDLPPFEYDPPSEQEAREFLGRFADARIAGEGAEAFLLEGGSAVQLLYATTAGFPYERFEITRIDEPVWPDGAVTVVLRMIAERGVVVEQLLTINERGSSGSSQEERWWIDGIGDATENGVLVDRQHGIVFDGHRLTFVAPAGWRSPWFTGIAENDEFVLYGPDHGRLEIVIDPWMPVLPGCDGAAGTIEELAEWISTSRDLGAGPLQAVTLGGVGALQLEVSPVTGAQACNRGNDFSKDIPVVIAHRDDPGNHPYVVKIDERMRIYLLEAPGEPTRTVAVLLAAPAATFNSFIDKATPILDSFTFETQS